MDFFVSRKSDGNMSFRFSTVETVIANRQAYYAFKGIDPAGVTIANLGGADNSISTDILEVTPDLVGCGGLDRPPPDFTAGALMTAIGGTTLGMPIADCLAIGCFAHVRGAPAIMLLHAGWRQVLHGFVGTALKAFCGFAGCTAASVRCELSPALLRCHSTFADVSVFRGRGWDACIDRSREPNLVDWVSAARHQLLDGGIRLTDLNSTMRCTAEGGLYFSHKRDSGHAVASQGRHLALLRLP